MESSKKEWMEVNDNDFRELHITNTFNIITGYSTVIFNFWDEYKLSKCFQNDVSVLYGMNPYTKSSEEKQWLLCRDQNQLLREDITIMRLFWKELKAIGFNEVTL